MYASPKQLPYAPTPHSYTPSSLTATMNMDEEVKLWTTAAERDLWDSIAEIYSIIITLDGLEKAYIKDCLPESEYTEICSRLLKQYKSSLSDETVAKEFVDLETFKREWGIECPRATERLRVGFPATVIDPTNHPHHSTPATSSSHHPPPATPTTASMPQILLATENFITFLDALKLNLLSKDQLHPLLSDVIQSVNTVTDRDFEGRGKIISWLIRLNGMRATEELGEEEARELMFEMEGAYAGFKGTLN
ncbi:Vacuolar protein-sorting-associated protein 28 [Toensbergia leucococca]|nr:Vacuolar protein-sorting-associated protein 28 [Toensbergia leucococca]